MDYLNGLDFDFDASPTINEVNDLDVFAQSEFFDLDVFAKDSSVATKPMQQQQFQQQQQQQPTYTADETAQQILVKLESEVGFSSPDYSTPGGDVIGVAAHEDKRKRNTAASARFRIKKKQKEQEMEAKAKKLQETVVNLEKKLKTLEMENKCLKSLILQQNERKNSDLLDNIKKRSIESSSFQFTT